MRCPSWEGGGRRERSRRSDRPRRWSRRWRRGCSPRPLGDGLLADEAHVLRGPVELGREEGLHLPVRGGDQRGVALQLEAQAVEEGGGAPAGLEEDVHDPVDIPGARPAGEDGSFMRIRIFGTRARRVNGNPAGEEEDLAVRLRDRPGADRPGCAIFSPCRQRACRGGGSRIEVSPCSGTSPSRSRGRVPVPRGHPPAIRGSARWR